MDTWQEGKMITESIVTPEIKEIKNDGRLGIFEIEPLSPGYGTTIANALRRVLLSSLQGASIYALKINGVAHEFSSIKGVKEDMISMILNVKMLDITLEGDTNATLKLKAKGPKKLTAKDIQAPAGCEIKNLDQEIVTLDKNASIDIEFFVDHGMGYMPSEKKKEQVAGELGLIFIDAAYTPVEKVNFRVENIRVGQATNYNKVYLEIETNSTINPAKALKESAIIISSQFEAISSMSLVEEKSAKVKTKISKKAPVKKAKAKSKPKAKVIKAKK